ncbi:MAG: ABC transporter permease [Acholeplasmataceae bacterium]|nr:ABC transporter permease [Acholeplasmataceae bacterium]
MKHNKLLILIKGELQRLNKYNVTTISFVVAVVWFLLLYFIDDDGLLSQLLPMVIVIDASMMSVIFIGAIMFFEKTESTFSTMLVTPVSNRDLILSKTIANTIHTVLSSLLIVAVFYFVRDVQINWLLILLALVISVFFHSLLGFVFSFHGKDFTSMLVGVMTYMFIFATPSILNTFNVVFKGEVWEYIFLILPTQATIKLIEVGFGAPIEAKFYISLAALLIMGTLGYFFYILPKFKEYAVKQSGV